MSQILDTHLGSKQVFLTNTSCYKSVSSGEAIFVFNDVIEAPPNVVMSIGLQSLAFCNSRYTINSTNNLVLLKFASGTLEVQITVPVGFYSASSFITAFQTTLDETFGDSVFAATYNKTTGRITLDGPSSFLGVFLTGTTGKTTCFEPLGYSRGDASALTDSNGVVVMPTVADFSGLNSVYFELMNVGSNCLDSRAPSSSTLARVNCTGNPGQFVFYESDRHPRLRITSRTLNIFHVRMTDRYGTVVDLNDVPWEATLEVIFSKVVAREHVPSVQDALEQLNAPPVEEAA